MAEVNATAPDIPQFFDWSEQPVTWSREDHPDVMPSPGSYSLLLDPIIVAGERACTFSRVLINGGSSINILYKDTADKLGLTETMMQPSRTTFHGIVPGKICAPIGTVWLDVIFGKEENFRRVPVWFEVVDHQSAYHAILGRPALTQFMAVLHCAYLKMKLPGPHGIITVSGDYKRLIACASYGSKIAESVAHAEELQQIKRNIGNGPLEVPDAKGQAGESQFQAAKDTKRIPLDASRPDKKFVTIGASLDAK